MHPILIDQTTDNRLLITWQDGSRSSIPTSALRVNCPCTECRSRFAPRSGYIPLLSASATTISEMELLGSSKIRITWKDGHSMSIYPYELLRQIAPPQMQADT